MRFFLITFAFITLLSTPVFPADKIIARLTGFSGTVLIKSQGSWGVKLQKDLPHYSKNKVVTRLGTAIITFNDGAVMEIRN